MLNKNKQNKILDKHLKEKNLQLICFFAVMNYLEEKTTVFAIIPSALNSFGIALKKKIQQANFEVLMKEREGISSLYRNRKNDYHLTRDGFLYLNGDWLLSTKDMERSELRQGDSEYYIFKRWQISEVC